MKMINTKKQVKREAMGKLNGIMRTGLCLLLLQFGQAHGAQSITFFHNDVLGSPVAVTDINGDLCWREDYRPYGEKIRNEDEQQPSNPLCGLDDNQRGYTNHVHDKDIGLTYMQARYYDPVIGRFMGIDPVGIVVGNQVSFNRYAYGNNNPYKYVDPNGEFAFLGVLATPQGVALVGLTLAALAHAISETNDLFSERADEDGLTTSDKRGIRSLEKQIEKHKAKLKDFLDNPTVRPGMEDQPQDVIEEQQKARAKKLEDEIKTFEENIDKIKENAKNRKNSSEENDEPDGTNDGPTDSSDS